MVQTFNRKKDGDCHADIVRKYVNSGMNINEALRSPDRTQKDAHKQTIQCLDTMAQPLNTLLPAEYKDEVYIIVYRTMTIQYDEKKTQGYTSTANVQLGFANTQIMKIYIPLATKVLLADISFANGSAGSTGSIFEIVLPRDTKLKRLGEKNDVDYYFVEQSMNPELEDNILEELSTDESFEFDPRYTR